jgi:hypothetical protein
MYTDKILFSRQILLEIDIYINRLKPDFMLRQRIGWELRFSLLLRSEQR